MVEATKAWTKVPLAKFNEIVLESQNNVIVHDQQGSLPVFFQYKHSLYEFHKKKIQMTMGSKTKEELLDEMRHMVIYCLGEGKALGIMVGNLDPNFTDDMKDDKIFPSQLMFDRARMMDATKKAYMPFVKDDENYSPGKTNKGLFGP